MPPAPVGKHAPCGEAVVSLDAVPPAVALIGELDISVIEGITSALQQAVVPGGTVVVDLGSADFTDASTVHAPHGAQLAGAHLVVTGARGVVRRVLEIVGAASWAEIIE